MTDTMQLSLRMEPELIRKIDEEAENSFKTRTDVIKEAVANYLKEKEQSEKIKKLAAELWLKGEITETQLKKALTEEEVADLKFGKSWIEEVLDEIRG